jgi:uncharacterized protein
MNCMSPDAITFDVLPGRFAVCRLGARDAVPEWAQGPFVSITRTDEELSIICEESAVPRDVRAERGWTCMKVLGPLPFEMVGVAAAITAPLAQAGISVLIVGTFDTDYVLLKDEMRAKAIEALESAGFSVEDRMGSDPQRSSPATPAARAAAAVASSS